MTELSATRLKELYAAERTLNALEAGGVDNWEFYGDALEEVRAEIEHDDAIEEFIGDIMLICSENTHQPAGPRCGFSVENCEDELENRVKNLLIQLKAT